MKVSCPRHGDQIAAHVSKDVNAYIYDECLADPLPRLFRFIDGDFVFNTVLSANFAADKGLTTRDNSLGNEEAPSWADELEAGCVVCLADRFGDLNSL
mgnify:CR=1 FL=1